jgi:hypothetical protein
MMRSWSLRCRSVITASHSVDVCEQITQSTDRCDRKTNRHVWHVAPLSFTPRATAVPWETTRLTVVDKGQRAENSTCCWQFWRRSTCRRCLWAVKPRASVGTRQRFGEHTVSIVGAQIWFSKTPGSTYQSTYMTYTTYMTYITYMHTCDWCKQQFLCYISASKYFRSKYNTWRHSRVWNTAKWNKRR